MKITRQRIRKIIQEAIQDLSDIEDFIEEVSWYQSNGIGGSLTSPQMVEIYKTAPTQSVEPSILDNYANSYTSLINGATVNDRFRQFVNFYLAEQRSPETTRGSDDSEKINYLKNLVQATYSGKINKPINILNVEGVGSFISGGRTRAAAAKVAGVPVNAKIISIPQNAVDDVEAAKKLHASLFPKA